MGLDRRAGHCKRIECSKSKTVDNRSAQWAQRVKKCRLHCRTRSTNCKMQALFWRLETSGVSMTVRPLSPRAVVSSLLHHAASAAEIVEAVGGKALLNIAHLVRRPHPSGQTQYCRFLSLASPHFVWQDYLWWRGRAPRSRRQMGQGPLMASLLWEDGASHAGASGRLGFDWSPTAAYQILTWQTGGLVDPPRTVRVKQAVAHPHVERFEL